MTPHIAPGAQLIHTSLGGQRHRCLYLGLASKVYTTPHLRTSLEGLHVVYFPLGGVVFPTAMSRLSYLDMRPPWASHIVSVVVP